MDDTGYAAAHFERVDSIEKGRDTRASRGRRNNNRRHRQTEIVMKKLRRKRREAIEGRVSDTKRATSARDARERKGNEKRGALPHLPSARYCAVLFLCFSVERGQQTRRAETMGCDRARLT